MTEKNNKWLVVVNPKASVGKAGEDWPTIKQLLINEGFEFDDVLTEYPQHAIEIVRNAITEKGYRKFVSVGGDGTNNEIINGIFTQDSVPTTDITMACIPIGTGNDWCRTFDIPLEYEQIIKIIKAGNIFVHDIGKLTYFNDGDPKVRYFLNAAGSGLDENICRSTNIMKQQGKKGTVRYLLSTVKCLLKYHYVHVKIAIDDQMVIEDDVLSLSIGNCKYVGGGMKMMRDAIPNDGLLDITAVRKLSILKFAMNVKNLYDGTFIDKLNEVSTFRGKKVRVVSDPPHSLNVETEGETLTNSPFDFEIMRLAINVVVPENVKF
ncbi:MAG: diacylglycerol kinase family lipid kinase [Bacteroidales bacterium]|nr:diacylglycerol kinase family lipid kinase [Bacteroidales bacterium]